MKYDCLIIDDEIALAETTCEYFNMFDVKTAYVTSPDQCLDFLKQNEVGLLLLDINLGETSGFSLCKTLRMTTQIPILFISARTSDDDVLMALGIGGDDYIKKPYTLMILLAKVKAVLKRVSFPVEEAVDFGRFTMDYASCRVLVEGNPVKLKTMEFKLLAFLVKNKNHLLTKDEIFENVWGGGIVSDSTLNVHIRHLREKIEINPNEPQYIKTVWGTGYVFEVKPS